MLKWIGFSFGLFLFSLVACSSHPPKKVARRPSSDRYVPRPTTSLINSTCYTYDSEGFHELFSIDSREQIIMAATKKPATMHEAKYWDQSFRGLPASVRIFSASHIDSFSDFQFFGDDGQVAVPGKLSVNQYLFSVISDQGVWSPGDFDTTFDGYSDRIPVVCGPNKFGAPKSTNYGALFKFVTEQKTDAVLARHVQTDPDLLINAFKYRDWDPQYDGGVVVYDVTYGNPNHPDKCPKTTWPVEYNLFTQQFKIAPTYETGCDSYN